MSVKIIYGAEAFTHIDTAHVNEILQILQDHDVREIDTAHLYANSEKMIGNLEGGKRFTIHTKSPGFSPGSMTKSNILSAMDQSLRELRLSEVETLFLHSPDSVVPLEETLEAIQELYEVGKFKHFGLSNFTAPEVQEVYKLASSRSYVLPSVYQGNYNPVARHSEEGLFPLLRSLNMKFYAYSPIAGGFLAKTPRELQGDMGGRWDRRSAVGNMYHGMYNRPKLVEALKRWEGIANEAGTTKAALAYRWMLYHSSLKGEFGDELIVGARKPKQLEETLQSATLGPLKASVVSKIEDIWELVKTEAPIDNVQYSLNGK